MNEILKLASRDKKFRRSLIRKLAMDPLRMSDYQIQKSRTYKYVLKRLSRMPEDKRFDMYSIYDAEDIEDLTIAIVREMAFSGRNLADVIKYPPDRPKYASQMSKMVVHKVLDRDFAKKYRTLYNALKDYPQYQKLLVDIKRDLINQLLVPMSIERAVNRFNNISSNQTVSGVINQLSKVGDELGLNLPSGVF